MLKSAPLRPANRRRRLFRFVLAVPSITVIIGSIILLAIVSLKQSPASLRAQYDAALRSAVVAGRYDVAEICSTRLEMLNESPSLP